MKKCLILWGIKKRSRANIPEHFMQMLPLAVHGRYACSKNHGCLFLQIEACSTYQLIQNNSQYDMAYPCADTYKMSDALPSPVSDCDEYGKC